MGLSFTTRGLHRPLRGLGGAAEAADVSPAVSLATFDLETLALPFISSKDLIWTTLPGETARIVNAFIPYDQPGASPFEHFQDQAEEGLICGASAGGYLTSTATGYVERAIINGRRFIHGKGLWGCTEKAFLRGCVTLIDEWIADLTALANAFQYQKDHRAAPPAMPEYVRQLSVAEAWRRPWPPDALAKIAALRIELEWAMAFFTSSIKLIDYAERNASSGDWSASNAVVNDEMKSHAKLGVGYLKVDDAFEHFGGIATPIIADTQDLIDFYNEHKDTLQPIVKAAGQALANFFEALLGDDVRQITNAVKDAGTALSAIPFVGTIASFILQYVVPAIVDAYTEEGTKGPYRGKDPMGKRNVETYMQMNYRALGQVHYTAQLLANGSHPLLDAIPVIGFAPIEYHPTVRPAGFAPIEYRPQVRPAGELEAVDVKDIDAGAADVVANLPMTVGKKVAITAGVASGAGLLWWGLKALGIVGRRSRR